MTNTEKPDQHDTEESLTDRMKSTRRAFLSAMGAGAGAIGLGTASLQKDDGNDGVQAAGYASALSQQYRRDHFTTAPDSAFDPSKMEAGEAAWVTDTGQIGVYDGSSFNNPPIGDGSQDANVKALSADQIGNDTHYVFHDGDAATIQSAIDGASPGDWIYVEKGEYSGNITIDKALHLLGFSVEELQETGNNIFASDDVGRCVISNGDSTKPAVKLDHGSSPIVGLHIENLGIKSAGPGIQTVKGAATDDPRLNGALFKNIKGVDLAIGDFLIDLSNMKSIELRNVHGHDLGSGLRFEGEDANVNYGWIDLYHPRIDINKEDGSNQNAGLRVAASNSRVDAIDVYGVFHVGSQNNNASNFYGVNAEDCSLQVQNMRAEGPNTLVRARRTRIGYFHVAHIGSDATIDDDNRNVYAFSEAANLNNDTPAGGTMPQKANKELFTTTDGPWPFTDLAGFFVDDFGDNGFGTRTDHWRGYARLGDGRTGLLEYRPPWTTRKGSPSVSSGELVLSNNSNNQEAVNTNHRPTAAVWEFDWYNATSPTGGYLEFRILTDNTTDNAIYAVNAPGNDDWTLYKQDGGTRTQLATTTGATTDTNQHTLYFVRQRDGSLDVYEDGTALLSARDPFLPSTTRLAVKATSGYDADVKFPEIRASPL